MRFSPVVEAEGSDSAETGMLAYPNFSLTGIWGVTRMDRLHIPQCFEVRIPDAES
jgi:hypothetical protein